MTEDWNDEYSRLSQEEHWDIFYIDGDPNLPEIEILGDDPGSWSSDDEVILHCVIQSHFGQSQRHLVALTLEFSHDHGLRDYPEAALAG